MKLHQKLTVVVTLLLIGLLFFAIRTQDASSKSGASALAPSNQVPSPLGSMPALDPAPMMPSRDAMSREGQPSEADRYKYFLVLAEESNQPVTGARASLDQEVANSGISPSSGGILRLPAPANGARLWYLKASGYGVTPILDSAGGDQSAEAVPVRLRRASMLSIRVLDASLKPLTGAAVELAVSIKDSLGTPTTEAEFEHAYNGGPNKFRLVKSGIGEVYHGRTVFHNKTDSNGECSWETLPSGVEISCVVAHGGLVVLRPASFALASGERRLVELVLPAKSRFVVKVIDATSRPVASVKIQAIAADDEHLQCSQNQDTALFGPRADRAIEAITNEAGIAEFGDINVGAWYLGPAAGHMSDNFPAKAPTWCATAKRVIVTRAPQECTLVVAEGQSLAGIVIDALGSPICGATLSLSALGVCGSLVTTSDVGGLFAFGPIPSGNYFLSPTLPNHVQLQSQLVTAGDIAVVVQAPVLSHLKIVAVDSHSGQAEPIKAVSLMCGNVFGERSMPETEQTFEARDLPYGQYNIFVRTNSGKAGFVLQHIFDASTAHEALRVQVSAASPVRIVNHHEVAAGFRLLSGTEVVAIFSVGAKGALVEELPPGSFQLECLIDNHPRTVRSVSFHSGTPITMSWP